MSRRQQTAVCLEADLRNVLSRRWNVPVDGALAACWQQHEPETSMPYLFTLLQQRGIECDVLGALLSNQPSDDVYWLELLSADQTEFLRIANHHLLLTRANHVRHQRLVQRAMFVRWRGYKVGLLNCGEEQQEICTLLADRCDLAIVWYWHRRYHLCLVSRRLDCLRLGAEMGRASGNKQCSWVTREQPLFVPSVTFPWKWLVGLPLALVGMYTLARSSTWTRFIAERLK